MRIGTYIYVSSSFFSICVSKKGDVRFNFYRLYFQFLLHFTIMDFFVLTKIMRSHLFKKNLYAHNKKKNGNARLDNDRGSVMTVETPRRCHHSCKEKRRRRYDDGIQNL